jgi:hypothetical protein
MGIQPPVIENSSHGGTYAGDVRANPVGSAAIMYPNRRACWVGLFSVCFIISGASFGSAAPPRKNFNSQLTALQRKLDALEALRQNDQKKLDALGAQVLKQTDQIADLLDFTRRVRDGSLYCGAIRTIIWLDGALRSSTDNIFWAIFTLRKQRLLAAGTPRLY